MIHPTAVVHPSSIVESGAVLDERVMVGPFCYIGKNVRVGAGTTLHSHIVINGLKKYRVYSNFSDGAIKAMHNRCRGLAGEAINSIFSISANTH